jgi:hypothetical protein
MHAPLNHPLFKEAILNLSENLPIYKKTHLRLRPTHREGLKIQYQLKDKSKTFVGIGYLMGVSAQIVADVVFGRRRSARVEAEIARILGRNSWDEVVLEARSAVTGKSVKTIVNEFARRVAERDGAIMEGTGDKNTMTQKIAARKRRAG